MKKQDVSRTDPIGVFSNHSTSNWTSSYHTAVSRKTPSAGIVFNAADKKLHSRLHLTFLMSVKPEMRPNAQIKCKRETPPQSKAFGLNRQTSQTQSECQQSLQQQVKNKRTEHNIPGKDLICKTNIFKTFPRFPNTDILYTYVR